MRYEVVDRGFVSTRPMVAAPRCAVTDDGRILCSFVVRSGAGTSDYTVHLAESGDDGRSWHERGPVFPHRAGTDSVTGSISRAPDGALYLFGVITPIDDPSASWWDPEWQGMKQNQIHWSRSTDNGRTWSEPTIIPMPIPGSAEAPGALLITQGGTWLAPYAPYRTWDRSVEVDRNQVVLVRSEDGGATWTGGSMLRFAVAESGSAEAWIIELGGGRLFGTCWHMNLVTGEDYPIAYGVSGDSGRTWRTRSTGITGQATGLATLLDGRAAMVYNQRVRSAGPVGVWLAVCDPTEDGIGLAANAVVWEAETATLRPGGEADHDAWQAFTFGEPGVCVLPDGELLVTIWSGQESGRGVAFVRIRLVGS